MPRIPRPETNDPRDVASFVDASIDELKEELMEHMDNGFAKLLKTLQSSFPEDNPTAHKQWHEEQLELLRDRRRLRQAVIEKVASGGVWAMLVGMGALIVWWAQSGFKGAP